MKTLMVSDIVKVKLAPGKEAKDLLAVVTKKLKLSKSLELDFNGIEVSDSITTDDYFKKLFLDDKYSNVYLRFHNKPHIVRMCKMLLKISGKNEERVTNVEPILTEVYQTADEVYQPTKKSIRLTQKLLNYGTVIDNANRQVIIYYNQTPSGQYILNAINTKDPVIALKEAIMQVLGQTGYRKAIVDFGDMQLFSNRSGVIAAAMCNLFNSMAQKNYQVELKIKDGEDRRLLEMTHEIPSMSTDEDEILEKIDNNLEIGAVGLLSEYVRIETKVDKFGHFGNGQVATRQPAVYLGRDGNNLKFRVYDAHTFMRRIDWIVKVTDDEEKGFETFRDKVFEVKHKDVSIPLENIGVCKFCNGNRYYFSLAIQSKEDEFIDIHYLKQDGTYGVVAATLPEFLKMVLNEQHEKYNLQMMLLCIEETEKRLAEKNIYVEDLSKYNLNAVALA